jgi:hypothetical protein
LCIRSSGKDVRPISRSRWHKDVNKGKVLTDLLNRMVTEGQKMNTQLAYAAAGERSGKGESSPQVNPLKTDETVWAG